MTSSASSVSVVCISVYCIPLNLYVTTLAATRNRNTNYEIKVMETEREMEKTRKID
jgi:hypothetical protein